MPDSPTGGDPGASSGGGNSGESRTERTRKITCEFCQCELYPSGELRDGLSAHAKKLRDSKRDNDNLTEQRDSLKTQVTELETKLKESRDKISELEAKLSALPAATIERPKEKTRIAIKV